MAEENKPVFAFDKLGFIFFKLDKPLENDELNKQLMFVNKQFQDSYPRVFASVKSSLENLTKEDELGLSKNKVAQTRVNQVFSYLIEHKMYPPGTDFMLICDRSTNNYVRDLYLFVSFVWNIQNHFQDKSKNIDIRSTVLIAFENLVLPDDGKQRYWFVANNQEYEYIFPEFVQDFHNAFRYCPHRWPHEWRINYPQISSDFWKLLYTTPVSIDDDSMLAIQTMVYPNVGIRAACPWERFPSFSLNPDAIEYLKKSPEYWEMLLLAEMLRPVSTLIRNDTIFAHFTDYFDFIQGKISLNQLGSFFLPQTVTTFVEKKFVTEPIPLLAKESIPKEYPKGKW